MFSKLELTRVEKDKITALVEVHSGPHRLVSLITREAADELDLLRVAQCHGPHLNAVLSSRWFSFTEPDFLNCDTSNSIVIEATVGEDQRGSIRMTVEISDLKHLERVMKSIRNVGGVLAVERASR